MGYISKDIAVITEPKRVTLAALPNFVQFASKPATKTFLELTVTVKALPGGGAAVALLHVTTPGGVVYSFKATTDLAAVSDTTFYLSAVKSETAENIRTILLANAWIAANFDISIPGDWSGDAPANGVTIYVQSKGAGADYNITVTAPSDPTTAAYTITAIHATSVSNDSISGEASTTEIELDIYTGADVFLGADDKPTTAAKIGQYVTSLQKTYAGVPVWFDLNALFNHYGTFNRPSGAYGWFNTGTASVYRFIAKVKGPTSFVFYYSNTLRALNGYGLLSDTVDLADYIYLDSRIKLLTNKPRTTYLRGQKEYLNFLFEDPQRDAETPVDFSLRVAYRAYATGGKFLGTIYDHSITRADLNVVNTCSLNMDAVLDAYPTVGEIRVALARGAALVSNDLEYQVRPECLHTLRPFTFLNRLGGWDTFNFDAPVQDEIKPTSDTFNKTITPGYSHGESIETPYATNLENTLTVEGAPVSDAVADWLKELAAARVILDGEGSRVILDDFTLRKTASAFNMQIPTIKYHLSETYTND